MTVSRPAGARIHPTALVEEGVEIGEGTSIWDGVHIRGPGTRIGRECIVGEKTYIAYGVTIGDRVKINAQVYICTGITIGDRVMIAAGVIFTNDRYPRAFAEGTDRLAPSGVTEETLMGRVGVGATIGAGSLLGPGVEVGEYAMVGMAAVVTRAVPAHGLVAGNPARLRGYVCVCGLPLMSTEPGTTVVAPPPCGRCGRGYRLVAGPAGPTLRPS